MDEKTGSKCPVCGDDIMKVTTSVPNRPPELMIMGPGGEGNYRQETSYHCKGCGVKFAFPTPQCISDMMKRHREMNAANTGLLSAMMGP